MPTRKELYQQMCAENEAAELAARRVERRYWIVTLLICWGWCVAGGAVTAYGFHVVDPVNGPVLVDAGQWIAAAGVLVTVLVAGHHRRKRGHE